VDSEPGQGRPPLLQPAAVSPGSDAADLLVAGLVREFCKGLRLEQERSVHAGSAAVVLPQAVPASNRVIRGQAPALTTSMSTAMRTAGR